MFQRSMRAAAALTVLLVSTGVTTAWSSVRPDPWGSHAGAKLDARTRAGLLAARRGAAAIAVAREAGLPVTERGELDVFIRGSASPAALTAAGARVRTALAGLVTAYVPADAVERVASLTGVTGVRAASRVEVELSSSVATTGATVLRGPGPMFAGLAGHGVLVGDVDTGADLGHGDFQDAAGHSRVVAAWDQTQQGSGAPGFGYGVMWNAAEIAAGLCTVTDSVGHGTHVLGIAAGDGSQTGNGIPAFTYVGMAPLADLGVVKTDLSNTGVLDGVRWLFDVAAARGQTAVVNLSLGTHDGPHDGTSEFERGLTQLVGPGRIVVKSAGNDRGVARHAELFATAAGAAVTLSVTGSAAGRSFGVGGWYDASDRLTVSVVTPSGVVIGPIAAGAENAGYPGQPTANGSVWIAHDSLDTGRKHVSIEVAIGAADAANGTWTIRCYAQSLGPHLGEVDLWRVLASTGVGASFVSGNQASRELVTEPGNAFDVITVGSYVTRGSWVACDGVPSSFGGTTGVGTLSSFSSPGPTRDGRMKPDLVAPGEVILSTTSFDVPRSCPIYPNSSTLASDGMNHIANRGTSMAAPHVAGAVALLLEKHGALTPAEVRDYLVDHASVQGVTVAVPNRDWGYGKLALGDLLDPTAQVVSPTGGETVSVGETLRLEWNATDALGSVTTVDLLLSRTGPQGPFGMIAEAVANTGSYDWTVMGQPSAPGAAFLRVVVHDTNGNIGGATAASGFTIVGPLAAVASNRLVLSFAAPRPNPAFGTVRLAFSLARSGTARLAIEDVSGRRVATLVDGVLGSGPHEAAWNAVTVRPGLYFAVFEAEGVRIARRLVVAR